MNARNIKFWQMNGLALAALSVLAGCSVNPIQPDRVHDAQMQYRPMAPTPIFSDADHALYCLGDRLREQKIAPLLIGYSAVADTTGKTGVDFPSVMRSELSKVVARGSNVAITAMGFGASSKPETPSVEERELQRDPVRAARLLRPDWLITGGTVSVTSAFMGLQKSDSISGRDVEAARSRTTTVDLVSLSFGVKWTESGVDLPIKTFDIRVSYQMMSASGEAGVFAQAQLDGRKLAAGLRFGRTVSIAQVPEDAIRAGVDAAIIGILSTRYGVDMSTCPRQELTPDELLPRAERLPAPNELPAVWQSMGPADRTRWFQGRLATYGYMRGDADGKLGPRTREALSRAAQDNNLPPTGQGSAALFYVLATRDLAHGHDPRKAPGAARAPQAQGIHVTLQYPNSTYATGTHLRASVVVPQAGYVSCWLVAPEGALSLLPVLPGRGQFASANTPVLLPDNNPAARPRVRLDQAGPHELWCGLARTNVTERLPADLRPGADSKVASVTALRQAFATAAGSDWMAEGSVRFNVVQAAR